jgi:fumarate reductase subunit D
MLALFLPLHFLALSRALAGEAHSSFLAWTQPLLSIRDRHRLLLAAHLTGGVRLLVIEFVGWHGEAQKTMLAAAGGVAAFCALLFALNLV